MIATAHFISGAIIAKKTKNPLLAWILAFASHFLLDAIPHAEYSGHIHWYILLIFDLLIGILSVLWLVRGENKKNKWKIWIGAILANVPDMFSFSYRLFLSLVAGLPLGGYLKAFLDKFFAFHFWTHGHPPSSFLFGTISQILIIVISFFWYQKKNP